MKILITSFFCFLSVFLFSQDEHTITFHSDTLELEGTLLTPNNNKEKHPVIIFVHGSGPNDRDQTAPIIGSNATCLYPNLLNDTIRNFKDMAVYFAQNNYATFRYDKRTYTYNTSLDPKEITPYDFITDLESAIDFLKTRDDIDTNCITLLGHSQGGGLIPYVAAKRKDIKNMLCLASPSTPIDTLFAEQLRDIYAQCGDSTLGYTYYTQSLSAYGQMRAGTWNMNTAVNGAYPKFWIDWIHLSDSVIYYTNLANIPSYHSFGQEDFNVPINEKIPFENNLTNENDINVFQDCTHYLTSSSIPTVKNEILVSIKNWLDSQECETGIDVISENNFQYTFNTYDDYFEITFENKNKYTLEIYNSLGQVILEETVFSNSILIERKKQNKVYYIKLLDSNNLNILSKTFID